MACSGRDGTARVPDLGTRAEAPPLVLLHALGEESSDWGPVAQALASSWRVYAPDLRGHGASDWAGPYMIEQLAADLAALLDVLELEHVALGGHSVGGPPAYLYAARHADRVTHLVLEDPAPPWPRGPRVVARPEGPLPFDWDVTALSNEFTDPQVSSWRDELRWTQAPALLVAGGPASHVDQGQLEPSRCIQMTGKLHADDNLAESLQRLQGSAEDADRTACLWVRMPACAASCRLAQVLARNCRQGPGPEPARASPVPGTLPGVARKEPAAVHARRPDAGANRQEGRAGRHLAGLSVIRRVGVTSQVSVPKAP